MAEQNDVEAPSGGAESRRGRLAARRRHRSRMVVGTTLAAIVVVVGAGVATYALANNTAGAKPAEPGLESGPNTSDAGAVAGDIDSKDPPRALTHAAPLKLWIGGDSLAGSFGPALGDMLGATGVVETQIDYKVSSGLSSNDIRDWYSRATQQMLTTNPEAVVFIIGTNDTPIVSNLDANHDGVPDWTVDYRAKVDRMMDLLVGTKHRPVIWLGPPTLGAQNLNTAAIAIDQLMQQEAAKRKADVTYIDTYKLFQAPDGSYSRTITDDTGKMITARIADGVHFTEDGAQYLARAVYKALDAHWKITQQADTAQPIGWTLASGSGELVPGFSSAPRSRYHSYYGNGNGNGGSNSRSPYTSPTPTYGGGTPTIGATSPPETSPPETNAPPPTKPPEPTPTT
jgi:hypothetical protein